MEGALSERFFKQVNAIVERYPDYHRDVYAHVFQSLEFACHKMDKKPDVHVSGINLVTQGIVPLSVKQWGFLAPNVFRFWGIESGVDIRNIIGRLVEFKILKQDSNDHFDDFNHLNWVQTLNDAIEKSQDK